MRIAEPACCPLWQGLESCYSLKKAVQLIEISRDSRSRMPENQATGLGKYADHYGTEIAMNMDMRAVLNLKVWPTKANFRPQCIEPDIFSVLGNVFLGDRDSLATFRDLEITSVRIG